MFFFYDVINKPEFSEINEISQGDGNDIKRWSLILMCPMMLDEGMKIFVFKI